MKATRILALLLAMLMALALFACDNGNAETEAPSQNETDPVETDPNETDPEDTTPEGTTPEDTTPEDTTPEDTTPDTTPEDTDDPTESDTTESDPENTTPEIKVITIAEAIALCQADGYISTERYEIRATIKTVSNAQYGGMIIYDSTGEISVYGTYSADGAIAYGNMTEKPYKGDDVVLHCIIQNYNGTPEVQNARLISFVSNQGNVDLSTYTDATIQEARAAAEGAKLKVSGIVARITYANGMKPNGFILVNGADSIYVFDGDAAARVAIGNRIEIAASKTYWILDTEQSNAAAHGYKGCNQLESVTLISNDGGNNDWVSASFPTTTVKDIMDNPVSQDITTQIFKVTALVKKVPGSGFVNYYIDDLDGTTGSYTYTQCNGNDFAWLDQFDGKICTVYLVALNAKSTVSGCVYRFLPIKVVDEGFKFNLDDAAAFAVKYYGVDQFEDIYTGDPALELITSVSSDLLGFENATLSYTSSNTDVVTITEVDGKVIMNCLENGTATITITGAYGGKKISSDVTVNVRIPKDIPSITVGEAIDSEVGEVVTVKGIVGPSLVNQTGFYLIDETGVIAVILTEAEMATVQLGHEVILQGTRAIRRKDGQTTFGQANLDACTILANNYGSHEYSTATFIEGKTAAEFYALNPNEDHGAEVYVITATVSFIDAGYYTSCKLVSGSTNITLYSSSASQYNFLKQFNGQEVVLEIAPCNWNSKSYYVGCVLAVRLADGTKVYNELNFSK